MKQLSKNLALLVLLLLVGQQVFSYDFEVGGIYYNYDADTQSAIVTKGDITYKGSIVIPPSVSYKGREMNVTEIGERAFSDCRELTEITLPRTITAINGYAFSGCEGLKKLEIPKSVKKINDWGAFSNLTKLETLVVEDNTNALLTEYSLFDFTTPKNLYLGRSWWFGSHSNYLEGIEILTIGNLVQEFNRINTSSLKIIYSMTDNPEQVSAEFSSHTYVNAILYVPIGCKEKYVAANGWKNFFNIQEMDVADMWNGQGEPPTDDNPQQQKCEKPIIHYSNGKLSFECATDGATCQSTITDTDIASDSENKIQLSVTYNISVYASKAGFGNSETVTATLCWIDADPKTEGIESGVAQVRANAVLIQSHDGTVSVEGVADGTDITIYDTSGQMVGSAKAHCNYTTIATNLRNGSVAIVRIGDKSLKILME